MLNLIIITALLTALVCWFLYYLRMLEVTKMLVDAADTIEHLHEKSKPIAEAVRLLELQRNRVQYKMDEQLKTQAEVKAFIERWK